MASDGTLKFDTSLDTGGLQSGMGKVASVAQQALGVFTGQMMTRAVDALANLGKSALDSVGQLEQNVGGVETLFGDAADAVIASADRAYQTAGIWSTNKADRVNHSNGCNMTVHRDYANKACPGQYLYDRHGAIAAAVNELLGSGTTQPSEAAPGAVQGFPATPFTVRVIIPDLNYRKGPGMSYAVRGQTGKGVFTITEVQDGWGKLKSGAGWIYLENPDYCTIQGVAAKPAEPDPADVLAQEIAGKVKGSGLDPADVLNRTKKILGVA